MGAAMHAYPGGNPFDQHQAGHAFWRNFVCDLFAREAINGEANHTGSALAIAAMLALFLGVMVPMWWRWGGSTSGRRLRLGIRALGAGALLGTMVVCLGVALEMDALHEPATVLAACTGLTATGLCVVADMARVRRSPWLLWLGVGALSAALVNLLLYARVAWFDASLTPAVPISQKVSAILIVLWLGLWISSGARGGGTRADPA